MCLAADFDDVRRMTAPRPFGVEGMDRAAFQRLDRMFDKTRLVKRVGMDHHLHIHRIGHAEAAINRRGRGAPIFVQFQRASPAQNLFLKGGGQAGIALACEGKVHGKGIRRLQHPPQMPRPGRAGGGKRAMRRPRAPAQHRGKARMQRIFDLLRADIVNMAVKPASRQDTPLARDDLGACADGDGDIGLRVGISRLADGGDAPILQANIRFINPRVIHHQGVGDDRVHHPFSAGQLRLAHAIADHLAAAKLDLLPMGACEITLDLDDQICIGKAQSVACGRPKHPCMIAARN